MSRRALIKISKPIVIIKRNGKHYTNATKEDFNNNILWVTGDNDGTGITTKTNPHSEITWTKLKEEMDKL